MLYEMDDYIMKNVRLLVLILILMEYALWDVDVDGEKVSVTES